MRRLGSCLVLIAAMLPAQAATAGREGRKGIGGGDRFVRGLIAFARRGGDFDAAAFSRLTGVTLHNPGKWNDQSPGGRSAQWHDPRNGAGVTLVAFDQVPIKEGNAFEAAIGLSGRPCIRMATFERAAGRKASYGGMAYTFVLDAPSPPPRQLGRENATLTLRARIGESVSMSLVANRAGPSGCVRAIGLDSSRTAVSSR